MTWGSHESLDASLIYWAKENEKNKKRYRFGSVKMDLHLRIANDVVVSMIFCSVVWWFEKDMLTESRMIFRIVNLRRRWTNRTTMAHNVDIIFSVDSNVSIRYSADDGCNDVQRAKAVCGDLLVAWRADYLCNAPNDLHVWQLGGLSHIVRNCFALSKEWSWFAVNSRGPYMRWCSIKIRGRWIISGCVAFQYAQRGRIGFPWQLVNRSFLKSRSNHGATDGALVTHPNGHNTNREDAWKSVNRSLCEHCKSLYIYVNIIILLLKILPCGYTCWRRYACERAWSTRRLLSNPLERQYN